MLMLILILNYGSKKLSVSINLGKSLTLDLAFALRLPKV